MLIFHASNQEIQNPDVLHSRENLDFGKGFYVTAMKGQAANYAKKFALRGKSAIISIYEFTLDSSLTKKEFLSYNSEWLDFVAKCRKGQDIWKNYDVIIGGVANDRVFNTIDLYFSGQMSKREALKRLSYEKPNHQICFTNQKAIDLCLKFVESQSVY